MKRSKVILFLLYAWTTIPAQNIYDKEHLLKFADYLYKDKEYSLAANEYKHVVFLGNCNPDCQFRLLNSYLLTEQFAAGIRTFNSIYPDRLACNDTIDMVYGKLLLLNAQYNDLDSVILKSENLTSNQRSFLNISRDLYIGSWDKALQQKYFTSSDLYENPYTPVLLEIENLRYKSPYISLLCSAIIPGSGKMYSGYWQDGFITLSIVGITVWQAYRGFTLYGSDRPYTWIFTTLSASFYISNLYGSFKAANMKNNNLRKKIHNAIEEVFNTSYTYQY